MFRYSRPLLQPSFAWNPVYEYTSIHRVFEMRSQLTRPQILAVPKPITNSICLRTTARAMKTALPVERVAATAVAKGKQGWPLHTHTQTPTYGKEFVTIGRAHREPPCQNEACVIYCREEFATACIHILYSVCIYIFAGMVELVRLRRKQDKWLGNYNFILAHRRRRKGTTELMCARH